MTTRVRSFFVLLTFLLFASSASAALIEYPFADFQGTVTLDPSNGTYYNNNVLVTSYTTAGGAYHDDSIADPFIGQHLNGNAFSGFHYVNGVVTADSDAEFDFYIGDATDYYLQATARDLQIASQVLDQAHGQYLYTASANLYNQAYHHTDLAGPDYSLFMAEYLAASSPTNPQGQIFTWDFVIPLNGDLLVNVSGKLSPISAVPLPAAVWLFGSALAGLGLLKRQRF